MATKHWFHLDSTSAGVVLGVVVIAFLFVEMKASMLNPSRLPVFNDRRWFEFGYGKATERYISDLEGLLGFGLENVRIALFMQSLLVYMFDVESNNSTIGRRCIYLCTVTFPLDPRPKIPRCNWR